MADTPKTVKTYKVKKKVTEVEKTIEDQKPARTLKLLRKVNSSDSGPLPGSIEEDFLLETGGDPKTFLRTSEEDPDLGPRYAPEGRLIPYTVVGSPEAFEKQSAADLKQRAMEEKTNPMQEDALAARRYRTLRKAKTPRLTPQEQLEKKLKFIEEGKVTELIREKDRLRNLPVGLRLIEERQEKCLKGYARMQSYWDSVSTRLATRSGKEPFLLLFTRMQDFREKIEELDYLDRAISSEEKAGVYAWYMSLRAPKGGRETYIPVGDKLSGLYTRIKERNSSAEPIIRKPRNESPEQMHRSFKDNPYFQKRMKAEELNRSLHPVSFTSPHLLSVSGVRKFEVELEALHSKGLDSLNLDVIKPGEPGEEVLDSHYDTKFKY